MKTKTVRFILRVTSFTVLSVWTASAQSPETFIAVHLEPTNLAYYGTLVKMVALADSFHSPLTLQFTPQWADTILGTPPLLAQMRGWQKNGHEIAAHHHAVTYGVGGWDGYTNRPPSDYPIAVKYRGNIQEYFTLLSRLAGDSLLLTGCITDAEVDWPAGILYRTEGHNVSECLSRPVRETMNGYLETRVGFGLINTKLRVDSAKVFYNSGGVKDIFGVVLHEHDHAVNPANLRSWLQFLKDKGKTVKTVRRILREYEKSTAVGGTFESASIHPERPRLHPAFPNPFNASTAIRFDLARDGWVSLDLADVRGRIVRSLIHQNMNSGSQIVRIDAEGLPSGMYFVVLRAEGVILSRKLLLLR